MLSNKAMGAAKAVEPAYVEEVFSTYLYTGNGTSQTIRNDINLGNVGGGNSVAFNGTSGGFGRTSKPVGAVDTKTITFSAWLYPELPNVSQMGILWAGPFNIIMGTTGNISFIGYPDSGNPSFYGDLPAGYITFNKWNNVIFSVDVNGANTSKRHVYINDVDVTSAISWYDGSGWFTDAAVNFDNAVWNVGQMSIVGQTWVGRITEMFLDTTYRDLTVEANRRVFYTTAGQPTTNLASLNPLIYLPMNTLGADVGLNSGTGGNFTNNIGAVSVKKFGPFTNDGKGGLVWFKPRNTANNHNLIDSDRGLNKFLISNDTAANGTTGVGYGVSSFNSDGFSLAAPWTSSTNTTDTTQVAWTFRKQPKFFDVVTWTGNGVDPRNIAHNLGSVPGSIIIKCTSTGATDWFVYHRSLGNSQSLNLNQTAAAETGTAIWGTTTPTSTVFTVGNINANTNGSTYVAYLFAHNAGGFGLSGNENVVSCGSFTAGTGSVNLGYEPQWIMFKGLTGSNGWIMFDTMRGWPTESPNQLLQAQSSGAESSTFVNFQPTATGFNYNFSPDCIYIAIRRGPMKVPTDGTKVFAPVAYAGDSSATRLVNAGVNIDANISAKRSGPDFFIQSRLTGVPYLRTRSVNAETSSAGTNGIPTILTSENNKFGFTAGSSGLSNVNETGSNYVDWAFTRAPTFFDVVCYTGTSANRTVTHNLATAPELMLVKQRSGSEVWSVYYGDNTEFLVLNSSQATTDSNIYWNDTSPTSSVFTLGTGNEVNGSGSTYVAHLFATCAGVSKVGSYTGTGTTQTINCGFTGGSRFVLIKRTDDTGDWYVWDSARGIVAGDDPYLLLNIGSAEVTSTDYIDPSSAGFEISSTAPAAINASGGSYIFLAVA